MPDYSRMYIYIPQLWQSCRFYYESRPFALWKGFVSISIEVQQRGPTIQSKVKRFKQKKKKNPNKNILIIVFNHWYQYAWRELTRTSTQFHENVLKCRQVCMDGQKGHIMTFVSNTLWTIQTWQKYHFLRHENKTCLWGARSAHV